MVGAAAGPAATVAANRVDETAVADLVRRAGRGDADAFGQLYDLYLDRVYRYVYYRARNATEAEDLTEEIFLKVWEAMPGYQWRGRPFAAWLFRLAHNHVVDFQRTKREAVELLDVVPSRDGRPEDVVARKLDAEAVRIALAQLTDEQREVVVLKFIEGLSTKEIAEIVGRQEGAVRALQMRALQALRRVFGALDRGEGILSGGEQ